MIQRVKEDAWKSKGLQKIHVFYKSQITTHTLDRLLPQYKCCR